MNKFRSLILVLLIVMLSTSLSGCIFSRLLTLKNRLRNFDEHYTLTVNEGIFFDFQEIVLSDSDIVWLMSSAPSSTSPIIESGAEQWTYHFIKQAPGEPLTAATDLNSNVHICAIIMDSQLHRMKYPAFILEIMDLDFIKSCLTAMGHGSINHFRRSITGRWSFNEQSLIDQIPTQNCVEAILGMPTMKINRETETETRYLYHLMGPDKKTAAISTIILVFTENGRLSRAESVFNGLRMALYFTD